MLIPENRVKQTIKFEEINNEGNYQITEPVLGFFNEKPKKF